MTEPITWAAVAMAAVSNIGAWLWILKRQPRKRAAAQPANPGPAPSALNEAWEVIREHGETLKQHDSEIKNIADRMDEGRRENREEHQSIVDKLDALRAEK